MRSLATLIAAALLSLPVAAQDTPEKKGGAVSDATLNAKVKSALAANVGMKTLGFNVDTYKGVVTLKGRVDSEDVRQRSEDAAKKVNGVTEVKNELTVKGG